MSREDFSWQVREALVKRAGYKCSFPGCGATTIGPSDEGPQSSSTTGMACHIIAAADGKSARRVVPGTPPEVISGIDNGIWMCYTHGKLIDTDQTTFTISMLKRWRDIAVFRAKLTQAYGRELALDPSRYADVPLPEFIVEIKGLGQENQIIGNALRHSCIHDVWGDELAHTIRDLIIEIARNAMTHGGASRFELIIDPERIRLLDDGSAYDPLSLGAKAGTSGGVMAVKLISEHMPDGIVLSYQRLHDENELIVALARTPGRVTNITPCSVALNRDERLRLPIEQVRRLDMCHYIYLVLPEFFSLSDVMLLGLAIKEHKIEPGRIVLVTEQCSIGVESALLREVSGCQVVSL